MGNRRHFLKALLSLPAGFALSSATWAQESGAGAAPTQLRFITPNAPGGTVDFLTRVLAQALEQAYQQSAIILNIPGAGGEIGRQRLLSEPADGRTWLLAPENLITINPSFFPRSSPDILDGIVPVALLARSHFYLLVRANDTLSSFEEFIETARSAEKPLAYGSWGVGTLHHLSMERLAAQYGLKLLHVPYKSNAEAIQALVRGDIRVQMAGTSALSLVNSGHLKMIAVTSPKRMPVFPQVPAISEFVPGYQAENWFGFFARQGTPESSLTEMRERLRRILEREDVRTAMARVHLEASFATGEAFMNLIMSDRRQYADIAQRLNPAKRP